MIGLCKTKAGKGNIELREIKDPVPAENEVLIHVKAAGICGSDIHIYNWDTQVAMKPPVVMGHEFSGVITAVGKGVADWRPGDRVTAEPSYSVCGSCIYCKEGRYNLCRDRKVMGFWADGAFAEYTRVPAQRVHRLPENIEFQEGALTEPFACAVHGVCELVRVRLGETVVVTGPGTIGLFAAQVAIAAGARVIMIGTDGDGERLLLSRELGADISVNSGDSSPEDVVMEITKGTGADVAVECAGAGKAVASNLKLLRKGGRYLQLGLFGKPIEVDFETIAYKELEVYGSFAQKWSAWKLALKMMAEGSVKIEPFISHNLPLSRWEEGFSLMNNREGMKIVLTP